MDCFLTLSAGAQKSTPGGGTSTTPTDGVSYTWKGVRHPLLDIEALAPPPGANNTTTSHNTVCRIALPIIDTITNNNNNRKGMGGVGGTTHNNNTPSTIFGGGDIAPTEGPLRSLIEMLIMCTPKVTAAASTSTSTTSVFRPVTPACPSGVGSHNYSFHDFPLVRLNTITTTSERGDGGAGGGSIGEEYAIVGVADGEVQWDELASTIPSGGSTTTSNVSNYDVSIGRDAVSSNLAIGAVAPARLGNVTTTIPPTPPPQVVLSRKHCSIRVTPVEVIFEALLVPTMGNNSGSSSHTTITTAGGGNSGGALRKATLRLRLGKFVLRDLDTTNGTFIDGYKLGKGQEIGGGSGGSNSHHHHIASPGSIFIVPRRYNATSSSTSLLSGFSTSKRVVEQQSDTRKGAAVDSWELSMQTLIEENSTTTSTSATIVRSCGSDASSCTGATPSSFAAVQFGSGASFKQGSHIFPLSNIKVSISVDLALSNPATATSLSPSGSRSRSPTTRSPTTTDAARKLPTFGVNWKSPSSKSKRKETIGDKRARSPEAGDAFNGGGVHTLPPRPGTPLELLSVVVPYLQSFPHGLPTTSAASRMGATLHSGGHNVVNSKNDADITEDPFLALARQLSTPSLATQDGPTPYSRLPSQHNLPPPPVIANGAFLSGGWQVSARQRGGGVTTSNAAEVEETTTTSNTGTNTTASGAPPCTSTMQPDNAASNSNATAVPRRSSIKQYTSSADLARSILSAGVLDGALNEGSSSRVLTGPPPPPAAVKQVVVGMPQQQQPLSLLSPQQQQHIPIPKPSLESVSFNTAKSIRTASHPQQQDPSLPFELPPSHPTSLPHPSMVNGGELCGVDPPSSHTGPASSISRWAHDAQPPTLSEGLEPPQGIVASTEVDVDAVVATHVDPSLLVTTPMRNEINCAILMNSGGGSDQRTTTTSIRGSGQGSSTRGSGIAPTLRVCETDSAHTPHSSSFRGSLHTATDDHPQQIEGGCGLLQPNAAPLASSLLSEGGIVSSSKHVFSVLETDSGPDQDVTTHSDGVGVLAENEVSRDASPISSEAQQPLPLREPSVIIPSQEDDDMPVILVSRPFRRLSTTDLAGGGSPHSRMIKQEPLLRPSGSVPVNKAPPPTNKDQPFVPPKTSPPTMAPDHTTTTTTTVAQQQPSSVVPVPDATASTIPPTHVGEDGFRTVTKLDKQGRPIIRAPSPVPALLPVAPPSSSRSTTTTAEVDASRGGVAEDVPLPPSVLPLPPSLRAEGSTQLPQPSSITIAPPQNADTQQQQPPSSFFVKDEGGCGNGDGFAEMGDEYDEGTGMSPTRRLDAFNLLNEHATSQEDPMYPRLPLRLPPSHLSRVHFCDEVSNALPSPALSQQDQLPPANPILPEKKKKLTKKERIQQENDERLKSFVDGLRSKKEAEYHDQELGVTGASKKRLAKGSAAAGSSGDLSTSLTQLSQAGGGRVDYGGVPDGYYKPNKGGGGRGGGGGAHHDQVQLGKELYAQLQFSKKCRDEPVAEEESSSSSSDDDIAITSIMFNASKFSVPTKKGVTTTTTTGGRDDNDQLFPSSSPHEPLLLADPSGSGSVVVTASSAELLMCPSQSEGHLLRVPTLQPTPRDGSVQQNAATSRHGTRDNVLLQISPSGGVQRVGSGGGRNSAGQHVAEVSGGRLSYAGVDISAPLPNTTATSGGMMGYNSELLMGFHQTQLGGDLDSHRPLTAASLLAPPKPKRCVFSHRLVRSADVNNNRSASDESEIILAPSSLPPDEGCYEGSSQPHHHHGVDDISPAPSQPSLLSLPLSVQQRLYAPTTATSNGAPLSRTQMRARENKYRNMRALEEAMRFPKSILSAPTYTSSKKPPTQQLSKVDNNADSEDEDDVGELTWAQCQRHEEEALVELASGIRLFRRQMDEEELGVGSPIPEEQIEQMTELLQSLRVINTPSVNPHYSSYSRPAPTSFGIAASSQRLLQDGSGTYILHLASSSRVGGTSTTSQSQCNEDSPSQDFYSTSQQQRLQHSPPAPLLKAPVSFIVHLRIHQIDALLFLWSRLMRGAVVDAGAFEPTAPTAGLQPSELQSSLSALLLTPAYHAFLLSALHTSGILEGYRGYHTYSVDHSNTTTNTKALIDTTTVGGRRAAAAANDSRKRSRSSNKGAADNDTSTTPQHYVPRISPTAALLSAASKKIAHASEIKLSTLASECLSQHQQHPKILPSSSSSSHLLPVPLLPELPDISPTLMELLGKSWMAAAARATTVQYFQFGCFSQTIRGPCAVLPHPHAASFPGGGDGDGNINTSPLPFAEWLDCITSVDGGTDRMFVTPGVVRAYPTSCALAHSMGLGKTLSTISFLMLLWDYADRCRTAVEESLLEIVSTVLVPCDGVERFCEVVVRVQKMMEEKASIEEQIQELNAAVTPDEAASSPTRGRRTENKKVATKASSTTAASDEHLTTLKYHSLVDDLSKAITTANSMAEDVFTSPMTQDLLSTAPNTPPTLLSKLPRMLSSISALPSSILLSPTLKLGSGGQDASLSFASVRALLCVPKAVDFHWIQELTSWSAKLLEGTEDANKPISLFYLAGDKALRGPTKSKNDVDAKDSTDLNSSKKKSSLPKKKSPLLIENSFPEDRRCEMVCEWANCQSRCILLVTHTMLATIMGPEHISTASAENPSGKASKPSKTTTSSASKTSTASRKKGTKESSVSVSNKGVIRGKPAVDADADNFWFDEILERTHRGSEHAIITPTTANKDNDNEKDQDNALPLPSKSRISRRVLRAAVLSQKVDDSSSDGSSSSGSSSSTPSTSSDSSSSDDSSDEEGSSSSEDDPFRTQKLNASRSKLLRKSKIAKAVVPGPTGGKKKAAPASSKSKQTNAKGHSSNQDGDGGEDAPPTAIHPSFIPTKDIRESRRLFCRQMIALRSNVVIVDEAHKMYQHQRYTPHTPLVGALSHEDVSIAAAGGNGLAKALNAIDEIRAINLRATTSTMGRSSPQSKRKSSSSSSSSPAAAVYAAAQALLRPGMTNTIELFQKLCKQHHDANLASATQHQQHSQEGEEGDGDDEDDFDFEGPTPKDTTTASSKKNLPAFTKPPSPFSASDYLQAFGLLTPPVLKIALTGTPLDVSVRRGLNHRQGSGGGTSNGSGPTETCKKELHVVLPWLDRSLSTVYPRAPLSHTLSSSSSSTAASRAAFVSASWRSFGLTSGSAASSVVTTSLAAQQQHITPAEAVKTEALQKLVQVRSIRVMRDELPRLVQTTIVVKMSRVQYAMLKEAVFLEQADGSQLVPSNRMLQLVTRFLWVGNHCELVAHWARCKGLLIEETTTPTTTTGDAAEQDDADRHQPATTQQRTQLRLMPFAQRRAKFRKRESVEWAVPALCIPSPLGGLILQDKQTHATTTTTSSSRSANSCVPSSQENPHDIEDDGEEEEDMALMHNVLESLHHSPKMLVLMKILHEVLVRRTEDPSSSTTPSSSSQRQHHSGNNHRLYHNEKVVVFSHSLKTLYIAGLLLQQCGDGELIDGVDFAVMGGSLSSAARDEITSKFNDPTNRLSVLLVSHKSFDTGTSFVGASRVVLYDPSHKIHDDLQAVFRCFRYGQRSGVVRVVQLVADSAIERSMVGMDHRPITFTSTRPSNSRNNTKNGGNIQKKTNAADDDDINKSSEHLLCSNVLGPELVKSIVVAPPNPLCKDGAATKALQEDETQDRALKRNTSATSCKPSTSVAVGPTSSMESFVSDEQWVRVVHPLLVLASCNGTKTQEEATSYRLRGDDLLRDALLPRRIIIGMKQIERRSATSSSSSPSNLHPPGTIDCGMQEFDLEEEMCKEVLGMSPQEAKDTDAYGCFPYISSITTKVLV